jgi:predicted XRE-type DNA-binding protein
MRESIMESSGNVFSDLGFDPTEAAVLNLRAQLLNDLRLYIKSRGMSQAQAAKKLGISRARVGELMRGEWKKFSLETLITLASRAGCKVSLELVT